MIPKIIHYCWLSGDPYPDKIRFCVDSWRKHLPDYEIRLWDLQRFDLSSSLWCKEAFESRKYAFAADYIRWYALFNEGGIYLDSDVEVIKRFDDLLYLPYFIGFEQSGYLEPAIVGMEKGNTLCKQLLDYYEGRHFVKEDKSFDTIPLPQIMQMLLIPQYKFKAIYNVDEFENAPKQINIFPASFFSPKRNDNFEVCLSENTYSIHHFNASWFPASKRMFRVVSRVFGYDFAVSLSSFLKRLQFQKQ